ncbi:uncharacterized protein LOC126685906 [Mercurialis annua]|uniref:uncharacterized protein LOC126685906 n=1 Tax=Mercurialis annua TaxID=3986 RepID=UPI00215F1481|nr:uncharacterized protein LOC126685906 [Mercurialis annua]
MACRNYFLIILLVIASNFYIINCRKNHKLKSHKLFQPPVFIKTEYGDVYDCVDINKQLSLSHPALANHTIMLKPNMDHENRMLANELREKSSLGLKEGCPSGSVPIRRYGRVSDLKRNSWNHGLEFAGVYTSKGEYHGSRAIMSIYQPKIKINSKSYSSSMISFESGEGSGLNQIQVGWTVNPDLYHDNNVRTYTSWTTDNHQFTGCYNMLCPGFVLVSPNFPLDMVLSPSLPYKRLLNEVQFDVSQDQETGVWWLGINKQYIVGYWPKELFTNLNQHADTVRWGGEIFTPLSEERSPPMGSGRFRNGNYDFTSYIMDINLINSKFSTIIPDESLIQTSTSRCFREGDQSYKNDIGYSFLFGGGGGTKSMCI